MPERSVTHATFVVDRVLAASPARVFAAWATQAGKARWFVGPDGWARSDHELDFRIGGRETVSGGPPGGPVHAYAAQYLDIVFGRRIVLSYDMHLDRTRISASLATVEFLADAGGTRLVYTEQGAFLDGQDSPQEREEGMRGLLDQLAQEMERQSARRGFACCAGVAA